ncbi:hypothetical protein HPB48_015592 [Haemaphysalis longicornis]|uniref:Uncharacterized protein n=1 Tax=Haemaphysalis longicornis TaxID=44386 RepID=A0A9J6F8I1_HAELO|nr:hypothetical protein HPB48_015592 [Haemaphysalis longicornis]
MDEEQAVAPVVAGMRFDQEGQVTPGSVLAARAPDPDEAGPGGNDPDMGPGSVDLSDLRRRYSGRLRHSLLLALLAAMLVMGLAFLLLVLLLYPHGVKSVDFRSHFFREERMEQDATKTAVKQASLWAAQRPRCHLLRCFRRSLRRRAHASQPQGSRSRRRRLRRRVLDYAQDSRRFVVLSVALLVALALLVLLALVPAEALLRRWTLPLGLVGWLLVAAPTVTWTLAKPHVSLVDPLAPAFVAAFLLHVVLPLRPLAALLLGPASSAGLLVATALLADWDTRHFGCQVAAGAVFLSMATAAGWYHRHMRDAAQSGSFASTQECIEARIKLEYEKEQQVGTAAQNVYAPRSVRSAVRAAWTPENTGRW